MKKFLLITFAFIATSPLFAQNFTTGGINYSVTSATAPLTVKVANHISFTGAANIPSTVTNAGTTYSVNSIGDYAFKDCIFLKSVSIPSSVTTIGEEAFVNCSSLTSVSIPNLVTNIGSSAFFNCSSLTSVSIPNSVNTIGNNVFSFCTGLTSVILPTSLITVGSGTFYNCIRLTSVSIPATVTSIGTNAFRNCIGLTSVSIPSSVTSIGTTAFQNCTGLTSVTVNWTTPLTITADVFQDITLANVSLNIPTGTLAAYQAAAVWKDFSNIKASLANNTFNKTTNINLYPNPSNGIFNFALANDLQIEVYNNLGQLLSSKKMISGDNVIDISDKAAGIYFVKANDGATTSTYKMIKN